MRFAEGLGRSYFRCRIHFSHWGIPTIRWCDSFIIRYHHGACMSEGRCYHCGSSFVRETYICQKCGVGLPACSNCRPNDSYKCPSCGTLFANWKSAAGSDMSSGSSYGGKCFKCGSSFVRKTAVCQKCRTGYPLCGNCRMSSDSCPNCKTLFANWEET